MKKIILIIILLVLVVSVAAKTIPTKEDKQKLNKYYFDKEKGMKQVTDYKKSGGIVAISFNNTSWRVFTSVDNFNKILKKQRS